MKYNEQVISASLDLSHNPTVTAQIRSSIADAVLRGDLTGLKSIIVSQAVSNRRPDRVTHIAFHACLRHQQSLLTSELVTEALRNKVRIRQRTYDRIMDVLLESVGPAKDTKHRPPVFDEKSSTDAPPDPSVITSESLRSALQLFLSAREEHRTRTQALYEQIFKALVTQKEYETAARLFSLVVQDHRRIRTRHLHEEDALTEYLTSEGLQPNRELLYMLSKALKAELIAPGKPDPYIAASCSISVACLAYLINHRHLPFWDFHQLIHVLFDFMYLGANWDSVWVPQWSGCKLVKTRDYVYQVLLDLIKYPPRDPIPEKLIHANDPIMPPLSWSTYAALLRGVRKRWRSEHLSELVANHMAKRFLGSDKTAQNVRTLYNTPERRKRKKHKKPLQSTRVEEEAGRPNDFKTWVSLETQAQRRATRQFQQDVAREVTLAELDSNYVDLPDEPADDEHSDAVDWVLGSGEGQQPDHTNSAPSFDDNSTPPELGKTQFTQLVSAWHGRDIPKKHSKS